MYGSLGFRQAAALIAGMVTVSLLAAVPAEAAASLKAAPAAPTLSSVTSSSVKVSWAGISGVATYRVKWSLKSNFDPAPTPASFGSSARSGTITGLKPETKYYFQVVGYDAANKTRLTSYGKYATTTTARAPATTTASTSLKPAPAAPTLSDVTSSSVKVSWAGISGIGTYRVKWSLKSNFDPAPTPASFGSTARSGTITGLTPETKYYFQVVGYDAADKTRLTSYGKYATTTTAKAPVTPPPGDTDLRVGTFNLSGANNDGKASGDQQIWSERKPVVVSQIVAENSDVVGLQEAYQSTGNSSGSVNQYTDLRNGLNAAGKPFEVTDPNKDASRATRIIYNTATLQMDSQGSFKYVNQVSGSTDRYLVWATFTQKATGKKFFFADTHLSPNSATVKKKEWQELIPKIKALNTASLPVISVGDFNTSKFGAEAKDMLPAMKAAGFGDVMNQEYQVNPPKSPRAQVVVNGWINSFNGYRRSIADYSYTTRHDKVGNGVDWIFATNSLPVKQWKVVIDFDPTTLAINGVIPSDHNMLSSIITLP
jgi:endonuclease/exonuclease/phosphatase family metal-dependent hydrolase